LEFCKKDKQPLHGLEKKQLYMSQRGEIITSFIGKTGIDMAAPFFSTLCNEHNIDDKTGRYKGGSSLADVFFRERTFTSYQPRSVLVDLDQSAIEEFQCKPVSKLLHPDALLKGKSYSANTFAKGHYTDGAEIIDDVLEALRKEAEKCESLQGHLLCHSISGGTGSGLGTLLMSKLRGEYPSTTMANFTPLLSKVPLAKHPYGMYYNQLLALHQLIEFSDMTFPIDQALILDLIWKGNTDFRPEVNQHECCGQVLEFMTSPWRFQGDINSTMRRMAVNLVPFPRLHFVQLGIDSLYIAKVKRFYKTDDQCRNLLCEGYGGNWNRGLYVTFGGHVIYRGKKQPPLDSIKRDYNSLPWIPDNIKSSHYDVPLSYNTESTSSLVILNTTSFREVTKHIKECFNTGFRRKAFIRSYTDEGMEEMEFLEAEANVEDLIAEYQMYEAAS